MNGGGGRWRMGVSAQNRLLNSTCVSSMHSLGRSSSWFSLTSLFSVSPLFLGNRRACAWCTPFVHRNINYSICLVCISESSPPSKNTAQAQLQKYISNMQHVWNAATAALIQKTEKEERQAGVGVAACFDHRTKNKLAEKKLPSFL